MLGMRAVMHFHLTFSGLVCLLSLWEAAGAMSFYDPFEGTESNASKEQSCHAPRFVSPRPLW